MRRLCAYGKTAGRFCVEKLDDIKYIYMQIAIASNHTSVSPLRQLQAETETDRLTVSACMRMRFNVASTVMNFRVICVWGNVPHMFALMFALEGLTMFRCEQK